MEKPQISSVEVASITVSLFLSLTWFNAVPLIVRGAGQGLWLSMLLATLLAIGFGYAFYFLQTRLPGMTFFEQALQLLGPVGGRAFIFLWVVLYVHTTSLAVRNLTAFFRVFMPETPNGAFVILFLTTAAVGASLGLEVILRSSIVLGATSVLVSWLSAALLLNKADPGNLLPLLPRGLMPPLITTASILVWLNVSAVNGLLFAYHPKPARAWRAYAVGAVVFAGTMLAIMLMALATLSPDFAASQQNPSYSAMRLVEIGRFIENMELLLVTASMAAGLVSYAVLLYAARTGFGMLFGIKNAPSLSWPIAVLAGVFSLGLGTSRAEVSLFLVRIYPVYGTIVPFGSILILILATLIRKPKQAQSGKG